MNRRSDPSGSHPPAAPDDADQQVVFRADAHGALLEATGWEALTGLPAVSVAGDGWMAMVHPEDRERVRAERQRRLGSGEPHEFECRISVGPDAWRWMQVHAAPVHDAKHVVGWLGTIRDMRKARMTRAALSAADVTTFEWDTVRQRVWGDSHFSRMFGIEMDADGTAPLDRYIQTIHPDDRDAVLATVAKTIESGQDYAVEYRVVVDGAIRWLLVRGRPERNDEGSVVRAPGLAMDVTERREAQAELHRRTQLLQAITDSTGAVIYAKDREGRMTYANRATLALVGKPLDEVLGRTDAEFLADPSAAQRVMSNDRRIMETGAGEEIEEVVPRPDGTRRVWASHKVPYRDQHGHIIGLLGVSRDVTESVALARALRETASRLQLFVEHAPTQIALFDREMNYVAASRAWWDAYAGGVDMTGRNHYALWPDLPAHYKEAHARGLRGEVVAPREDSLEGRDGRTRWLRWGVHPWREGGGDVRGIVLFSEDITEQRQAEEQVRAAQRMDSAGRIAGGVAHEANNQMTVALAASDFLLEREDLAPDARTDVLEIRRAAERTASICQQLLAFSRRQVLRPEVLEADEVVRDAQGLLARTLGAGTPLELALDAPATFVSADRGQLEQVLLNLVINARDALGDGGVVRLRSRLVTHETPSPAGQTGLPMARNGLAAGAYWTLAVEDTGAGMDAATLARASEPFFTTKPTGQGTGLGLSVVQGVLHQSGGGMALESAPGRGTTVHLFLPRVSAPAAVAGEAPASSERKAGGVVWVVEDEPALRRMAARALEAAGYVVRVAGSADEALELLEGATEPPACVVSDMVMPGRSGATLAAELRARWTALPILLMSGYPDADRRRPDGSLATAFLAKPFAPRELVERVAELVRLAHPMPQGT